jgi:TorA maturation chaperone TorD
LKAQSPDQKWINKAALFELLAASFLFTSEDLALALVSGDYDDALLEIGTANGLAKADLSKIVNELTIYHGAAKDDVFHELRQEYTRLFIGSPKPAVSPFAGIWYAEQVGVKPLLFVNKESMAVERFMRSCGIGQPKGTNEPLDHIGTELEFLQYLCMLRAQAVQSQEGVEIPERAYEDFYQVHFAGFSSKFAAKTAGESRLAFFKSAAQLLLLLPEQPL